MAIASLVLFVLSFCGCGCLSAIPAAIIGSMELGKIQRGESSPEGKTFAQVGYYGGIVMTIVGLCFACLSVVFQVMVASNPNMLR